MTSYFYKNYQMHIPITVQTTVEASPEKCWNCWTSPSDILQFNNPFADWHTAKAEIDLKEGGRFFYRMESTDRTNGFDFAGKYDKLILYKLIEYTGDDGRKTVTRFTADGSNTTVTEIFEPDTVTPLEIQRNFCQGILDNFKKHMASINH
jgi:uncharacterized protein YndB with AHSA1/START domain